MRRMLTESRTRQLTDDCGINNWVSTLDSSKRGVLGDTSNWVQRSGLDFTVREPFADKIVSNVLRMYQGSRISYPRRGAGTRKGDW